MLIKWEAGTRPLVTLGDGCLQSCWWDAGAGLRCHSPPPQQEELLVGP